MKKLFEGVYKEINFEIIEYGLYKDEKYLCGYVEVPKLNKHFKDYGYDFSEIECHGGITYNEGKRSTGEGHYIGFDTMHYFSNIKHRTIEFCKTECKNIIKQLLNKENKMGLCMRVKKSGDEFDIGYGGYFALRYHIISCIDKEIAYKWKKGCIYGKEYYLTLEEFKVLYDSKLTDFLFHSDCDGLLGRRKVKRTLLALEKLNFENKDWEKEFEELKNILRIAVKHKSSIKYY